VKGKPKKTADKKVVVADGENDLAYDEDE